MQRIKLSSKNVDGLKINYASVGHGPSLIFLHGWTNNWEGWGSIIPYLKNKYTLYFIDMPGYGDSGSLPQYSIHSTGEYIAHLIKKLQIKPRSLIGMSMSSFVVADVAINHPEIINSVVLLGPMIKNVRGRIGAYMLRILLSPVTKSLKLQKMVKRAIDSDFLTYAVAKHLNMYKFDRSIVEKYGLYGKRKMRHNTYPEMGISGCKYNLESILREIKIPTLLIYGREDKLTDFRYAQKKVLSKNNLVKLAVIPFAGHVTQWEKPQEVAESIISFAKSG